MIVGSTADSLKGSAAAVPGVSTAALAATLPAEFARMLMSWHRAHGRHDLPWQGTRDPYRIWLSEVMLQQTQVVTVRAYYVRFLQRFADVRQLAAASLDDVLAIWSGLGYYSRARQLHRCAQVVVNEHGAEFPRSSAALLELPGIGRSTAAAIAAFCFDERAAVLDGNVKRVLTRLLAFDGDLAQTQHERRLWSLAQALLPARGVAIYTQALMDLGATVCLARQPRCYACPAAALCVARRDDRVAHYPLKTRRPKRGYRSNSLLLLQRGHHVWLTRRATPGVWAGLWSLPEFESALALRALSAAWPGSGLWLPEFEHALTHFDWALAPCRWTLPVRLSAARLATVEAALAPPGGTGRWWTREAALAMGLPAPVRMLIENN